MTFPGLRVIMVLLWWLRSAAGVALVSTGDALFAFLLAATGSWLGVLLVLPIGGADVPIVISLLNAFTGLAVAASGLVLSNVLLLIAGTLVGASGTILTMAMAKAMGRTVTGIVFGAFRAQAAGRSAGGGRPSRADDGCRRCGDPAGLRAERGHRPGLRARGRRRASRGGRARRGAAEPGVDVVFGIHPWPVACPAT